MPSAGRAPPKNFRLRLASLDHIKKCASRWDLGDSDIVRIALAHLWATRTTVDPAKFLEKLEAAQAKETEC